MAVTKRYSEDKQTCKVTFTIPKEIADNFTKVNLLGDFNNWDPNADRFTEQGAEGNLTVTKVLPANNRYQFRYLADGEHWFNEDEADEQIPTYFGSNNSVIIL